MLTMFYIEASGFGRGLGVLDVNKDSISKCYMLNPALVNDSDRQKILAAFEKVKKAHKGRKDAHNASADCIFQLDWLKESIDNLGYYVSEQGIKETLSRKD